jgi:hypothetical protein
MVATRRRAIFVSVGAREPARADHDALAFLCS